MPTVLKKLKLLTQRYRTEVGQVKLYFVNIGIILSNTKSVKFLIFSMLSFDYNNNYCRNQSWALMSQFAVTRHRVIDAKAKFR